MPNAMFNFVEFLLRDVANRDAFWYDPEGTMDGNGLTDREKQLIVFSMNRSLICHHLLADEFHEPGNTKPLAAYEALVKQIVDDRVGWNFDRDPGHSFALKMMAAPASDVVATAAALAWSDPDPKSHRIAPNSDAQLGSPRFEFLISGAGLYRSPHAILFAKDRLPSSDVPPEQIPATFIRVESSRDYDTRTLRASVDLSRATTGMYRVIVYNAPWWSVPSDSRFQVTKNWS